MANTRRVLVEIEVDVVTHEEDDEALLDELEGIAKAAFRPRTRPSAYCGVEEITAVHEVRSRVVDRA